MIKFKKLDARFPFVAGKFLITPINGVWNKISANRMGTTVTTHEPPNFAPRTVLIACRDGGLFNFSSADLAAGPIGVAEVANFKYEVIGRLNGELVFNTTGNLPPIINSSAEQVISVNGDPAKAINLLSVTISYLQSSVDHIGYGLSNMNVVAVEV